MFYFIIQTSWTNLQYIQWIVITLKNSLTYPYNFFFQSTKSPHLPLRGKVGQLRRRKRVLCWSIYIITVVYGGEYAQSRHKVCRCGGDFLGTNVTLLVYMRCHLSLSCKFQIRVWHINAVASGLSLALKGMYNKIKTKLFAGQCFN